MGVTVRSVDGSTEHLFADSYRVENGSLVVVKYLEIGGYKCPFHTIPVSTYAPGSWSSVEAGEKD